MRDLTDAEHRTHADGWSDDAERTRRHAESETDPVAKRRKKATASFMDKIAQAHADAAEGKLS